MELFVFDIEPRKTHNDADANLFKEHARLQ